MQRYPIQLPQTDHRDAATPEGGGPMHMQTVQINNVCMSRPTQHEKQETAKPWRQNKTFAQTFASTDTDQVLWNQS